MKSLCSALSPLITSLYLFGCLIIASSTSEETTTFDIEEYTSNLVNRHLLPKNYNKNIQPNLGDDRLQMNVSVRINDVSSISETTMSFAVDFYIRHDWIDKRLSFPVQHNVTEVSLEEGFSRKIWLPDTYFEDSKGINIHKTVNSEETTRIVITSEGAITYSTKIYMVAKCSMDLTYFPIDQQKCSIKMASYSKTTKGIQYNWTDDPRAVEFNDEIYLPTFHLVGYNKLSKVDNLLKGNFTYLQLEMIIERHIDFYIARVYLPAFLVVIISWVPFWLDQNSHHARVALGVTTVLTMTTLITNTNSELPKISHLTALDVYLFFCFLLVFLSLIEYATVGYYEVEWAKAAAAAEPVPNGNTKKAVTWCLENGEGLRRRSNVPTVSQITDPGTIDLIARRIFPIVFALFNVAYTAALCYIAGCNNQTKIQVKL